MALFKVANGRAVIYSSGSLRSLIELGGVPAIVITPTAETPPGDPVIVDISYMPRLWRGSSIIVENGATALVRRGIFYVGFGTNLILNGGILDLRSNMVNVSVRGSITIGPQGG